MSFVSSVQSTKEDSGKQRGHIKYLKSLLALAVALALGLAYLLINRTTTPSFQNLLADAIPGIVGLLVGIWVIHNFFHKRGLEGDFGDGESAERLSQAIMEKLDAGSNAFYNYIDGQTQAMEALTHATLRAKREIRSTRFFPMAIRENNPQYAEAIRAKVLGVHPYEAVERYFRIVAVNHMDKLADCREYVTNFRGKPFVLYLADYSNDFELVVIDDNETFIHFYGEQKIISSTLHLRGRDVAARFKQIFAGLHTPTQTNGRSVKKIDLKYVVTDEQVNRTLEEVRVVFDEYTRRRLVDAG